jgi:hypothetical protein
MMGARSSARTREIVGSVIAERFCDLVALAAVFAVLTWGGVAGAPTGKLAADIAAAAIVLSAATIAVCLALRRRGRLEVLAAKVRPFARASKLLVRPAGVPLAGMSFVIWLLEGFTLLLVGNALGLHLSVFEALLTAVIAALASSLPAGPAYAGSYDAAVLLALHASGVTGASAVGFLLLARFVVFVPVTIVGAVLLVTRYGGLHRRRGWTRDMRGQEELRTGATPRTAVRGAQGDL